MKKATLLFGMFFAIFSIASVLASGSINLKVMQPVTISQDGLLSIANNGTIYLSNVVLSSSYSFINFSVNHFNLPVSPGDLDLALVSQIHVANPQALYFGYNYLNITAKSNENVSSTISSTIVKSFCNNGAVGGALIIDGVNIINLNGKATTWHAGDHVKVEVILRNADAVGHSDTFLKMGLFTSQGYDKVKNLDFINGDEELINVGALNSGSVKKVIFDMVIPLDFQPRDYRLALKVYDKALGELAQCQDTNHDLDAFYYQNIPVLATVPVYDCQSLDQPNSYYALQNNISTDLNSRCLYVKAPNVTLNMNGYTLQGNNHGFGVFDNEADYFLLYGGTISNFTRGAVMEDSYGSRVENVSFSYYTHGTQVEIDGGGNHTVRNNKFSDYGHSNAAVFIDYGSSFNQIEDNSFFDNDVGILIEDSSYNTIKGGSIVKTSQGIILRNAPYNTIRDVSFNDNPNNLLVDVDSAIDCEQTTSNLVGDGGKPVVYLKGESHLSNIEVNELVLCGAHNSTFNDIRINSPTNSVFQSGGIVVVNTNNASFSNIYINNSYEGIHIERSSNISLTNSSIQNSNFGWGIFLEESTDTSFTNSSFYYLYRAIEIDEGNINAIFTHNNVHHNSIGLTVDNDNYFISIYDNIFNNTQNAHFTSTDNYDLNTYMHKGKNIIGGRFLGGNYWADPDYKNGFSETCADNNFDGLCDKYYVINPYVKDEIPLARKNVKDPISDY